MQAELQALRAGDTSAAVSTGDPTPVGGSTPLPQPTPRTRSRQQQVFDAETLNAKLELQQRLNKLGIPDLDTARRLVQGKRVEHDHPGLARALHLYDQRMVSAQQSFDANVDFKKRPKESYAQPPSGVSLLSRRSGRE